MKKQPKKPDDTKKKQKIDHQKPKLEEKDHLDEKKPVRSKEEIQSIVDRL